MSQHVGPDGVPLRHDGTPFPNDPSEWTEEEKEYMRTYYFGTREEADDEQVTVAAVDVPDIHAGEGGAYA
ncbi:MAG TPA: hypothetical protein VGD67_24970 [Pseudonocardiaceae bacterium]